MDGGQIMVIVVVAIIMIGSIIRAGIRGSRRSMECGLPDPQVQAENQRLRDEVAQLKERMKVIERITVEKENSLAKEIDSLRDR